MRDAALSRADPGSSSRGYRAQGQTKSLASGLEGGQGCRPTRLRNVVWTSAERSRERRDTSRRERGNAPRRDAYPNTNGKGNEHDD
jgi:hypothetical protein